MAGWDRDNFKRVFLDRNINAYGRRLAIGSFSCSKASPTSMDFVERYGNNLCLDIPLGHHPAAAFLAEDWGDGVSALR